MNEIREWIAVILTGLGMDILAIKSGMIGGFMSLTYEKKRTPRQAIISILSGTILAGYLGPLTATFFGLEGAPYSGVCFLIGLLSMRIVPVIFSKAEDVIKDIDLLKRNKKDDKPDKPSA